MLFLADMVAIHAGLAEAAKWLGITAGALISFGVLWRYIILGSFRLLRRLVRLVELTERAVPLIEDIATEFKPNSGHSLHDTIARIDTNIGRVDVRIDALATRQVAFEEYVHGRIHDLLNVHATTVLQAEVAKETLTTVTRKPASRSKGSKQKSSPKK